MVLAVSDYRAVRTLGSGFRVLGLWDLGHHGAQGLAAFGRV